MLESENRKVDPIRVVDSAERFEELMLMCPPEGGDIEMVFRPHATPKGRAVVCVTFTVQLPDGQVQRVQAVNTVDCLVSAALGMEAMQRASLGEPQAVDEMAVVKEQLAHLASVVGCLEPGEDGSPSCDPYCLPCKVALGMEV